MRLRRLCGVCIILSLIILVFSSFPAKADFKVYDADDQYLGIFLGGGDALSVYNADKIIIIDMHDELLSPIGEYADINFFEPIYYTEDGCGGYPYVHRSQYYTDIVSKIQCDNKVYHVDTTNISNATQVFTFKSRRFGCSCDDTNGTSDAFYLRVMPFSLPFSTPIKLPVRLEQVEPAVTPKAKVVVIPLGD